MGDQSQNDADWLEIRDINWVETAERSTKMATTRIERATTPWTITCDEEENHIYCSVQSNDKYEVVIALDEPAACCCECEDFLRRSIEENNKLACKHILSVFGNISTLSISDRSRALLDDIVQRNVPPEFALIRNGIPRVMSLALPESPGNNNEPHHHSSDEDDTNISQSSGDCGSSVTQQPLSLSETQSSLNSEAITISTPSSPTPYSDLVHPFGSTPSVPPTTPPQSLRGTAEHLSGSQLLSPYGKTPPTSRKRSGGIGVESSRGDRGHMGGGRGDGGGFEGGGGGGSHSISSIALAGVNVGGDEGSGKVPCSAAYSDWQSQDSVEGAGGAAADLGPDVGEASSGSKRKTVSLRDKLKNSDED